MAMPMPTPMPIWAPWDRPLEDSAVSAAATADEVGEIVAGIVLDEAEVVDELVVELDSDEVLDFVVLWDVEESRVDWYAVAVLALPVMQLYDRKEYVPPDAYS